jgi:hypothetical protein
MEGEKEGCKTLDLKYRFKDLARVKVENIIVEPKRPKTVFWHQGLLRLMFSFLFFLMYLNGLIMVQVRQPATDRTW